MPSDSATRRFAWIVGLHALACVAAAACVWLANGFPIPSHLGAALNITWFAIVVAQTQLLQVHAAFGSARIPVRLATFAAAVCYAAGSQVWFFYQVYFAASGFYLTPTDAAEIAWNAASGSALGVAFPTVLIMCLRSQVGVIRRASPLSRGTGFRVSLLGLLVWTAGAAVFVSGSRYLAEQLGYGPSAVGIVLGLLLSAASTVGITVAVLSERHRLLGLLWMAVPTAAGPVLTFWMSAEDIGNSAMLELTLHEAITRVLALAIVFATLWPLRRAGYRLTAL